LRTAATTAMPTLRSLTTSRGITSAMASILLQKDVVAAGGGRMTTSTRLPGESGGPMRGGRAGEVDEQAAVDDTSGVLFVLVFVFTVGFAVAFDFMLPPVELDVQNGGYHCTSPSCRKA
jgi:hypothetical protein